MIEKFHYAATPKTSEKDFQTWRRQYPQGFVINCRSRDFLMLHRADCGHFYDEDSGRNNTAKPKLCSLHLADLEAWVDKNHTGEFAYCTTCMPR